MKVKNVLVLSSLLASPVALAIGPASISAPVPAITSAYGAGTTHTVIYTITNRVPKSLPITLSGISGPVTRTTVANDCGASLPPSRGGVPSTCSIGLQIFPTNAQIGSTVTEILLIDSPGIKPLKATISFTVRQAYLYVTSNTATAISQCPIDLETGVIGTCIPFADPTFIDTQTGISVNPTGTYAYVSNANANTVSVCPIQADGLFSACTSATADLALLGPAGSSINPAGTFFYTSNSGANSIAICPINSDASLALCTDQHPTGLTGSRDLVINAQNTYAYIVNSNTSSVFQCAILEDGNFGACNLTGPIFSLPRGISMNPAQTNIYVNNGGNNTVSVCPLGASGALVGTCVSSNPGATFSFNAGLNLINAAGTFFFAANQNLGTVSVCPLDALGALGTCTIGVSGLVSPIGLALA